VKEEALDRATAEKLMAIYSKLNAPLNEAAEVIGAIHDQEEQKRLRRPLGEVMQSVWLELMQPIVRQHPDLDPDKRRSS
jgi:hypothetical protein